MLTEHSFLQRVKRQAQPFAGKVKKVHKTSIAVVMCTSMLAGSIVMVDLQMGGQNVLAAEAPFEAVTEEEAEIQIGLTDLREDGRLMVGNTLARNAVEEQQREEQSKEEFAKWAREKQEEADLEAARKAEEKRKAEEERQRALEAENRRKNAVISYSDEDYRILQRIVQAEAGNCDAKGKILVANVVINRVKSKKFPSTIKGVVYAPRQFSPVGNGSINRVKVTNETVDCVNRALAGEDYSQGALYFMNRSRSKGSNVSWFDSRLQYLFYHGGHEFFR